jgi:hypothetical protein
MNEIETYPLLVEPSAHMQQHGPVCQVLAPLRHSNTRRKCLLVGVDRKLRVGGQNDANDPKPKFRAEVTTTGGAEQLNGCPIRVRCLRFRFQQGAGCGIIK